MHDGTRRARFKKFRLGKFSMVLSFENPVDETNSCCSFFLIGFKWTQSLAVLFFGSKFEYLWFPLRSCHAVAVSVFDQGVFVMERVVIRFSCVLHCFLYIRRSKGGLATFRKRDGHSQKDGFF